VIEAKQDDEHLPRPIQTDTDLHTLDGAISRAPQPYRLIFTLLRETGMRADEVLSLNVGDVILDVGREGLRVREAKNNRDRMVVLDSDQMKRSLRLLRAWLRDLGGQTAPTMPLFRSNRGTRVSYDALHYQWVKVCQTANLVNVVDAQEQPRYTIHQLRHTVGSTLIRELPEQIVSRILGHRDPRSTRRYAEVTEEQVRLALAQKRWK
jgi:integrase/recombinase XerD